MTAPTARLIDRLATKCLVSYRMRVSQAGGWLGDRARLAIAAEVVIDHLDSQDDSTVDKLTARDVLALHARLNAMLRELNI